MIGRIPTSTLPTGDGPSTLSLSPSAHMSSGGSKGSNVPEEGNS